MASANVESEPLLIGDGTTDDDGDTASKDSGNVPLSSPTTAAIILAPVADATPADAAADELNDTNDLNTCSQTTPNGKRSSKKQKLEAAGNSTGGSDRKEREEWSDSEIKCLLNTYTEKFLLLNRSNLRGKDWEVVGGMVAEVSDKKSRKSIEQCKNKIDNLKKRYKVEIQRMSNTGATVSNWNWFSKLDVIVGNMVLPKSAVSFSDDDKSAGGNSGPSLNLRRSARLAPNTDTVMNKKNSKSARKWQRVVFKVSGTALAGSGGSIDPKVALQIAKEVATVCRLGVEVAIVVGARNFFCGDSWVSATDLDRPTAYQIGMMATVMNSILLQSALEKLGVQTHVQSAFAMPEVAEPYNRLRAIRHLAKGRVVIFGGIGAGSGNPLFTTDTAAALRAQEINADAVVKGTNVNGIYEHGSRNSVTIDHMSFREVVSRDVTCMDMMAIQFCEENRIPVVIFNLLEPGNVSKALSGEQVGTLIDEEG